MRVELLRVNGWEHLDAMFLRAVVRSCSRVGIDPSVLLAVMSSETGGTFNPALRNGQKGQTATGLIQMIERTARSLGTSTAALARMSNVEQMGWVERYFVTYGPKSRRLVDMRPVDTYLVVFSAGFVGKPLGAVMFSAPSKEYELNKGFDPEPRKGSITVGDVARVVDSKLAAAKRRPPLVVEVWGNGLGWGLVAGTAVAVGLGGLAVHAGVVPGVRAR